ncbi:MAG: FHA domain-containing protein [Nitrospirota bacterium]
MRIICENCRTVFEVSTHDEDGSACPYCEHVNHPAPPRNAAVPRSTVTPARGGMPGKSDLGTSTMVFPPDAETKPDPETSIRQAVNGKSPFLPAGRPFELVIVEGDDLGKRFVISKPEFVIGRGIKADIQLKDVEVSREHCVIESFGETLLVRDLRSANGTVLNGFLVRRDLLKVNDRIHIGNTTLEVARSGNGASPPNGAGGKKR